MKALICLVFLCISLNIFSQEHGPCTYRPIPKLPKNVYIKTTSQSFGRDYYVAIRGGKLCIKPMPHTGFTNTSWILAKPQELFDSPLISVSADGDNLVVVTKNRKVYYAKFEGYTSSGEFDWDQKFGFIWNQDHVYIPQNSRGIAVSHRAFDVGYYEDIDGNRFEADFGVSTLYSLSKNGQYISYTDPWLEPDWSLRIVNPLRGRFIAVNMSASASTLFIISEYGEMYTRLADYDTVGENPIPWWYSYQREYRNGKNVRTLPGEDWRKQPLIAGSITSKITILQNGKGNAARELRIAGWNKFGHQGYWTKPIIGEGSWRFEVSSQLKINRSDELRKNLGNFRNNPPFNIVRGKSDDKTYKGELKLPGWNAKSYPVTITNFDPYNSPAKIAIDMGSEKFKALIHFRRVRPNRKGELKTSLGTFEVLEETINNNYPPIVDLLDDQFGFEQDDQLEDGKKLLMKMKLWISKDRSEIEITEKGLFGLMKIKASEM